MSLIVYGLFCVDCGLLVVVCRVVFAADSLLFSCVLFACVLFVVFLFVVR